MKSYKISLTVETESPDHAKHLASLLQSMVKTVAYADFIRLLEAVKTNPKIVKTALKFL